MAANKPIPLMIVSDSVSAGTGFARIVKDLATRIHAHLGDVFRLATFGYGGPGDCSLGFPQFYAEGVDEFVLPDLPRVWENFAGEERGILLCVWDVSRLSWLACPKSSDKMMEPKYRGLQKWLEKPPFQKWLYCPVDASGPNDRMTFSLMKTLLGFDRILAYSEWGKGVIERTIGEENARVRNLDWLPHGIDGDIFSPSSDRNMARSVFDTLTESSSIIAKHRPIKPDEKLIGIVATNQARKDFGVGIATCAILAQRHNLRLWIHTDELSRHWDILGLLIDYQLLGEKTLISTGYLPDQVMADAYSACDLVLGIAPEGYGYVHSEAQACGCPVATGAYGAGAELVPPGSRVLWDTTRLEGIYSQERPVYNPRAWASIAELIFMDGGRATLNQQYFWHNLWPRWGNWLLQFVKNLESTSGEDKD